MQGTDEAESPATTEDRPAGSSSIPPGEGSGSDDDSVLDVSGKSLELSSPLLDESNSSVRDLYLYKNEFNLLPRWVGRLQRLKTLKFFANQLNLFPPEFGSLVGLERLQVKVSSPGLDGLAIHKLKELKEIELSKALPRPSVFPLLAEISQLKCLTKLSVCHFSIRSLPPEIGCLDKLEHLDLSFNKIKSLPNEITYLNSLISLKVAHNKLVELPLGLASLQRLENLDLSNNRLTSVGPLRVGSMCNLRTLNLQYNRLLSCQIPSWICCNLEGNGCELLYDDYSSSSVDMDVNESNFQMHDRLLPYKGSCHASPSLLSASSSSSRSFSARRSSKRWKRRYYLQQRARQERLNNSRKWKGEKHIEDLSVKPAENSKLQDEDIPTSNIETDSTLEVGSLRSAGDKELVSGEAGAESLPDSVITENTGLRSEIIIDSRDEESCEDETSVSSKSVKLESHKSKICVNIKRHCDKTLENPKPCKFRRPTDDSANSSRKYSTMSLCSAEDHLPDGFYDAGRDRPFMSLKTYEEKLLLESREVILMDRGRDEVLDAITLSAQALVFEFRRFNCLKEDNDNEAANLHIASLLALFVSDHFGGCDRTSLLKRMRKAVSGSNYEKPFACTCSTGSSACIDTPTGKSLHDDGDTEFADLCEKSLHSIKVSRNSVVVPIGTLNFGVCRHRALLLKYICDRMEPPVPCELVRGYLDFSPHAWNVVLVQRGNSLVRMLVDACRPLDIREDTDPEYFCRYIPLSRLKIPASPGTATCSGSFPSLSSCEEIGKEASTSLVRCTYGSTDIAAKVRTLEVGGNAFDDIRNFEYSCLGEVRMLGVLEHPCIVKFIGHQMDSKWLNGVDGNPERRLLRSVIYMEHIKGGSLRNYVEKLSKSGNKHVPVDLALVIARDVASALVELHSKHIIHRDIKSDNILVDLEHKRPDGTPVVKVCDFDRAVPLRASVHTCCIGHTGVPPPNICVGTPRWMAPEVLQAMQKPNPYGLEVDIWSYGCLLLELLTLRVPFADLSDSLIYEHLQNGERPNLTDEMEALVSSKDSSSSGSDTELNRPREGAESLRFLIDLFHRCTEKSPADRLSARDIYESLLSYMQNLVREPEAEQE